jgi:hypothetical protein
MSGNGIIAGVVIRYPYLWARQAHDGESEGRKSRPTAVGFRLVRAGGDLLLLFPITTSQPSADRRFIEIPETEKHRAGLDIDRRQWIILDETNVDADDQSFYLEPDSIIGHFSRAFFAPLMRQVAARISGIEKVSRR